MYLSDQTYGKLASWIRDEIEIADPIKRGARGIKARRVQEWLNLHRLGVAIDDDFGTITENAVMGFQKTAALPVTGVVDQTTFSALTAPMRQVLDPLTATFQNIPQAINAFAVAHLAVWPREVGGQNRGPWVRMYMKGNEGDAWAWCAGFVTFLMEQASELTGLPKPIPGSFSCDSLAAQAKSKRLFLKESAADSAAIKDGSLFLVRRTSTDWTHVGMTVGANDTLFGTIEGNTNDDGSREGYEVCQRQRGYGSKDFIVF